MIISLQWLHSIETMMKLSKHCLGVSLAHIHSLIYDILPLAVQQSSVHKRTRQCDELNFFACQ